MTVVASATARASRAAPSTVALAIIALTSNVRLAALAGVAAGAVWTTRVRYAGAAAMLLLSAVALLSSVSLGA